MNKIKVIISKKFSIEQCRLNFKSLFIFGDNDLHTGMDGQAIIREQANSIGIRTKHLPSMTPESFFSDKNYEANCISIDEDIQRVKDYGAEIGAESVIFPQFGIGTGLAAMTRYCPKTFCYLTLRLLEEFEFNNIEFLKSAI